MSAPLSIVADQQILFAKQAFSLFGNLHQLSGREINSDTVVDADILFVRSVTRVNEALLKNSSVKFVGSATAGIDHIDLDYLNRANIHFTHAPGSNARSVVEYVLSAISATADLHGFNLESKTVGIIGCGNVGSRLKTSLMALNIKHIVNDPPLQMTSNDKDFVAIDQITNADIITIHVPLEDQGNHPTRHLIDHTFLNKLKEDVILINTSRGEVVDEEALLKFKLANPKATLILDVWKNEPEINLNLLQEVFIGTPHIAGYSFDGKLKATRHLQKELSDFFKKSVDNDQLNSIIPETEELCFDNDDIHLAILQAYDIRSDATGLRQLFVLNESERSAYFDSLRKNYPVRREFKTRKINIRNNHSILTQQLKQLGFRVI